MKGVGERSVTEFLAEAEEILESMADDLLHLESCADSREVDPEAVNSVFRGAHSLKGISGMFGFSQVTEVSHKMETLLESLRMGRVPSDTAVVNLLLDAVDLIKALCARLAKGDETEDPRVGPFVEQLLAASETQPAASAADISCLGLPEETLRVLSDYEVHRIEETLRSSRRTLMQVSVSLGLESFDAELEALSQALKDCGELISTLPGTGPASGEVLDFDLILGARVSLSEVVRVSDPFKAKVILLGAAPSSSPSAASAGPASTRAQPSAVPTEASSFPSAPAERGQSDLQSLTKTIRVDLSKLDALMNQVGELVLTKGRIQILSERLRERMGFAGEALDLTKAQRELERKVAGLQQAVMEVRMVPLGQVFSKLHRVMRKVLQECGKDAELEIHGADTELDKLIVEDLSDPLVHVIRNAVDHGIEEPHVRESKGKPRRGTVRVSARQKGNHVLIEVSDDGAGLSRERIRAKAVQRGLVAEAEELDDRALFDLVFLPGFSTRDAVTEISGRGVGMDVLRKNVSNLSGMIELSSEEGCGTTVTITLPITLAIIQALLVGAAQQVYAVPLSNVLETLSIEPGQVKSLEGRPVLHLREKTLPLIHLDGLLGLKGHEETAPAYAVVVGVAEKRAAFGVDSLLNQRDVVIKSLGTRLRNLPGIAGATDLGDQRTILVLDVAALLEEVFDVR